MLSLAPLLLNALFVTSALPTAAADKMSPADLERTVTLITTWIGGNYSTAAQHEADQASNKPDNEKHRLMFQLFTRVETAAFPGVVFFEQGSRDGSEEPDMIWRSGLVQVIADTKLGVVRYRELAFKDQTPWRNAHRDPTRFGNLTPDMVTWDANCDFLLSLNDAGTEIAGQIPPKACSRKNDGTGEMMYADDRIAIGPGTFGFLGRYVDKDGNHVWGNESGELNHLVRFTDLP